MILGFSTMEWVMIGARALIMLIFLAFGWRDVRRLFQRPAANMGMGLSRVWAVSHTTILESWAGRVWLLPVLWLTAALILISVVRPLEESERMPLNIRMLLESQTILLLVMMWVMASLSLPRERERKIIVTNASKPLSRLEIVLGKIVGFSMVAGILLVMMGGLSWGLLLWENHRIKNHAAEAYRLQTVDYNVKTQQPVRGENVQPPSESLKVLSEEGSLFAYNYIAAPVENMSIVGTLNLSQNPPTRYIKGGSSEKVIYRFQPRLEMRDFQAFSPVGTRPFFIFQYVTKRFQEAVPEKIEIHVSAIRSNPLVIPPPRPQETVLRLNTSGKAAWEPDAPLELFSPVNAAGEVEDQGEVTVEVQCLTPGIYLEIMDGAEPDPATGSPPPTADFNVFYVPDRSIGSVPTAQPMAYPRAMPITRGFERRGRQSIEGPRTGEAPGSPPEAVVYRFPGTSLRDIPLDNQGNFTLALNMETYKTGNMEQPTFAIVQVRSMDQLADAPFQTTVEVSEKRRMTIGVPKAFLGNSDQSKRGDMIVMVACRSQDHSISFAPDSVRIEKPQSYFAINLFKSEVVIFLEAVLLISIAVTCSVRVGWPVAMLCSSACVMFGFLVEFIASLQEYGGGGLGALNYRPYGGRTFSYQFFDNLAGGIWKILGGISAFVPNFAIYRPEDYISSLQNMPWSVVFDNAFWTAVFILPFVGVAYLLFRKQELG